MVVARLPELLRHEVVHANDQHVFVVRAVENGEFAEPRRVAVDAPQEVVVALLSGGNTERSDDHAARIEAAHDVLDRAVLSGAVAALKHHHDAVHLGAEHRILKVEQLLSERFEALLGFFAGHAVGRFRRDVVQPNFFAGLVEKSRGHDLRLVLESCSAHSKPYSLSTVSPLFRLACASSVAKNQRT
ncbi:hypothetical protein D3C83_12840 [compost metagenome]